VGDFAHLVASEHVRQAGLVLQEAELIVNTHDGEETDDMSESLGDQRSMRDLESHENQRKELV